MATKADLQALELRLIKWLLGVAAGATVVIIGAIGGMLRLMLPG